MTSRERVLAPFDAINPVQISAAGMEPERLKRESGRDVLFWGGGCDTKRCTALDEIRGRQDSFAFPCKSRRWMVYGYR